MLNSEAADILIIDDVLENLKLLVSILSTQGYKVRPASSGAIALESIQIRKPDLILLDIKMPEMDGYEVCRQLKEDERTAGIPIIFITALHESADLVKGFNIGAVDYIHKPFREEEVLARVTSHLQQSQKQKQLAKQLEESETQNRLFVQHAPDIDSIIGSDLSTKESSSTIEIDKGLVYDSDQAVLVYDGDEVQLNIKEKLLLLLLLQNRGRIISYEEIEVTVWETSQMSQSALKSTVHNIHKKAPFKFIENYAKEGYYIH